MPQVGTIKRNKARSAGAVTPQATKVGPASVQWAGNMTSTRVHRYDRRVESLPAGSMVPFSASELGVPGNMFFDLQVWAPGVTDTWWDKQAALKALDLHVESPFFTGGRREVGYLGQAGIDDHDFRVQVRLSEMLTGSPLPFPGKYPVSFMAGDKVIASFILDWS